MLVFITIAERGVPSKATYSGTAHFQNIPPSITQFPPIFAT